MPGMYLVTVFMLGRLILGIFGIQESRAWIMPQRVEHENSESGEDQEEANGIADHGRILRV
jgi:hypothetical protein